MSGEWDTDRLDLDAYLHRIEHDATAAPTGPGLASLHRAHLAAIPFENLDIMLGRGVSVDLESVQAKLVHRRRGGYCYEHGVLFAAALERLGYTVDRLLARVGGDGQVPRPRTHLALHVEAEGARWLADVGFGSGLLEPLPFEAGGARSQGGWTYALVSRGHRSWELRERRGPDWMTLYRFDEERQHAADVLVANHFSSTHPRSPFVGQPVVVRKDADSIRRLLGRRLTLTRPDGSTHERQLTDGEIADALRDDFRVPLSSEEVAAVTLSASGSATRSTPRGRRRRLPRPHRATGGCP